MTPLAVDGVTVYSYPCSLERMPPERPGLVIPVVTSDIPFDGIVRTFEVQVVAVNVDFAGDLIGSPVAWAYPAVRDFGRIEVWNVTVAGFIENEVHDALYAVAEAITQYSGWW